MLSAILLILLSILRKLIEIILKVILIYPGKLILKILHFIFYPYFYYMRRYTKNIFAKLYNKLDDNDTDVLPKYYKTQE